MRGQSPVHKTILRIKTKIKNERNSGHISINNPYLDVP